MSQFSVEKSDWWVIAEEEEKYHEVVDLSASHESLMLGEEVLGDFSELRRTIQGWISSAGDSYEEAMLEEFRSSGAYGRDR